MKKWMIEAKAFEYERHYNDCKKNNQPFIKARVNRDTGNYLVVLDMATCKKNLSITQKQKLKMVFHDACDLKKHFEITDELCSFDGIKPDRLDDFLSKIFAISVND